LILPFLLAVVILSYFHRSRTFLDIVGRTNTEYHTLYPVYGSNANATTTRKVATIHSLFASLFIVIVRYLLRLLPSPPQPATSCR
jgi:hypothetical protein